MHADALAWAGRRLGEPVGLRAHLPGGMTSTMLALATASGGEYVLRLMTAEPWRTHGAELVERERDAFDALAGSPVPAPRSVAVAPHGLGDGAAAHLMTRLSGSPTAGAVPDVGAMADVLGAIHAVRPAVPFRPFQTWAWEAKWVVPEWTRHPEAWRWAFDLLAGPAPAFTPTFLQRDFSHRNLLWDAAGGVSGVVDWVETSTGPAWLDAAHGATNLAVAHGVEHGWAFIDAYAAGSGTRPERHWLVMDAVGFLPPPGRPPMFGDPEQLRRLDDWLVSIIAG